MLASGANDNLVNVWSPLVAGQTPLHSLTHHQAAVKVSTVYIAKVLSERLLENYGQTIETVAHTTDVERR